MRMGTEMTVHTGSPNTITMVGMGCEWGRLRVERVTPKWWLMDEHRFGLIDFALLDKISILGGCFCFQPFCERFNFVSTF